jgi:hypothetical protein
MVLAILGLMAGLPILLAEAHAQTVYVPHSGRVVAVPLPPPAPVAVPAGPIEGGLLRVDGLPAGAALAIDGRFFGTVDPSAGWIALPPGPHVIEVALPGGAGAIRLTVVTPVENDGYHVIPKP